MVWSSSTTRHVGWLRSVLTLWPDGLNASNPFLPDPLASPPDGSSPRFRIICSFSDAIRSIEPYPGNILVNVPRDRPSAASLSPSGQEAERALRNQCGESPNL